MSNTQNVNLQSAPSQGTNTSQGIQAIFDMEAILTEMMRDFMNQNSQSAQLQGNMGNLMENAVNEKYEKISEELKKEEESKPKHWYDKVEDFFKGAAEIIGHLAAAAAELQIGDLSGAKAQWKDVEKNPELVNLIKALTYVVAAVTIVAGCVTGNFELVAVTGILLAVTQSGILNKIESHIGSSGGKLAFDIAIIAVATLATGGAGAFETVAETAGEEAGAEFNLGKAVGMGAMGYGSALGSVNLSQDLVNVFDPNGKNKQKIEEILQIVQDVDAAAAMLAGGGVSIAASTTDATGALSSKLGEVLSKIVPDSISEMMSSMSGGVGEIFENNLATISKILQGGELVGNGTAAVLSGANATNMFRMAGIQEEVGKLQGSLEKLMNSLQQNTQDIKSNDQIFQNTLQAFSQITDNFSRLVA